jgi:hypothetical protein
MSRWIGVLALAAFACVACGGDASQAPSGPSSGPVTASATQGATILGNVTAGQPLGAMAAQVVGTSISSPVNTSGGFTLDNVPAGAVQLRFVGSGIDASVGLNPVQPGDVVSVLVGVSGATATIQAESRNAGNKVELEGRIESLPPTQPVLHLLVSGRLVETIPEKTEIRLGSAKVEFGAFEIGQRVHIKGTLGMEKIVAESILIQNTNTWVPVNVNGILEALNETSPTTGYTFTFKIGSRFIQGDLSTKIYGDNDVALTVLDLKNGQRVEVKGEQGDNFVYAVRIHINGLSGVPSPPQDDSASVEGILQTEIPEVIPPGPLELIIKDKFGTETKVIATSATVVQRRGSVVSLAALYKGQTIHAVGTRMSNGTIEAKMLQIKDDAADGWFVIEGSLGGLKGTCPAITFGVNGYTVKTDEDTAYFSATPPSGLKCTDFNKNGMKVGVEGYRQADGTVKASKVTKK